MKKNLFYFVGLMLATFAIDGVSEKLHIGDNKNVGLLNDTLLTNTEFAHADAVVDGGDLILPDGCCGGCSSSSCSGCP